MARIRTIKPSFFKNEELAELPLSARLLFIGLWCLSDKEGRTEDRPKRIKAELFPYDNIEIDQLLSRLQSAGFIRRYEVGEMKVIQTINFSKHQRITGTEATSISELPEYCTEEDALSKEEILKRAKESRWKQQGNTLDDRKGKEGKGDMEGKGEEPDSNILKIEFNVFWDLYDKKTGEKNKLLKKWEKLTDEERQKIIDYLPLYKAAQPDKTYRKNPETFLNNRSWEDEIINSNTKLNGNGKKSWEAGSHQPVITGTAKGAGKL